VDAALTLYARLLREARPGHRMVLGWRIERLLETLTAEERQIYDREAAAARKRLDDG